MTTTSTAYSDNDATRSSRIGPIVKRFDKIAPSASFVELIDTVMETAEALDTLEGYEIADYILKMIELGNSEDENLNEVKLAGRSSTYKKMRQKRYYRRRKQFLKRKREEFQRSIKGKRAEKFKKSNAGKYKSPVLKKNKTINRSKKHSNFK
jgi:hypothetical protein